MSPTQFDMLIRLGAAAFALFAIIYANTRLMRRSDQEWRDRVRNRPSRPDLSPYRHYGTDPVHMASIKVLGGEPWTCPVCEKETYDLMDDVCPRCYVDGKGAAQ